MPSFNIHPLSRFESAQTSIKRPREVTFFSFDDRHALKPLSLESLRYYYPPFIQAPGTHMPRVDLSAGFQDWVQIDGSVDGHLDALLETLRFYEKSTPCEGAEVDELRSEDIVTWRGMMTKIMTAPFDIFSDFEMNATCFQGTIYIEENHSYALVDYQAQKNQPARNNQPSQQMMQYWGYKFENLSVLPRPWSQCSRNEIDARHNDLVNNNAQYCSVVRTSIGTTKLLLAGEVDCVLGEKPSDPREPIPWVELKTTAESTGQHPREMQKWERKLLKFWAQSFLLGVPKIAVGFRSPDGHLTRVQEIETQRIPAMVTRGQRSWNGNVCINFTAAFLQFLKQTIQGTEGVWRIKRAKNARDVQVFKVLDSGTGEMIWSRFKEHREEMDATHLAASLGKDVESAASQE